MNWEYRHDDVDHPHKDIKAEEYYVEGVLYDKLL